MNRKRLLIALACALGAMAIAIPTALAGGAQKVPLSHQVDEFCTGGQIGPLPPETNGFAVIHQVDGNVMAEVSLKGGLPNTTYNVRLIQTPSGSDCFVFDGTLTTNGQGNGNAHIEEPLLPGTTDAFAFLSFPGFAGDFYSTPDVVLN